MVYDKNLNKIPLSNLYKDAILIIQWGGCTWPPWRRIVSREEALSKSYSTQGVSFYYVLSREPHPGFYGFHQPDSLKERQEYTRLAAAELQFDIPWIIDEMDNTMQKTFGGMPNMEFVIDSDGTLLASWDWANPKKLKKFLEKKVGPAGISDEEWKEISKRKPMMVSLKDNDEVLSG